MVFSYYKRKYALQLLKKFYMENCKATTTSLVQNPGLVKDDGAIKIEILVYRGLIGSLLYLIATRLNLM